MLAGNAFDDVRRRKLQKLIKLLSFITCAPAHTGEKRFLVCVNIISSFVTQGVRAKPVDTLSANRSENRWYAKSAYSIQRSCSVCETTYTPIGIRNSVALTRRPDIANVCPICVRVFVRVAAVSLIGN